MKMTGEGGPSDDVGGRTRRTRTRNVYIRWLLPKTVTEMGAGWQSLVKSGYKRNVNSRKQLRDQRIIDLSGRGPGSVFFL